MEYFGILVGLAAIPFSVGFFALCFWWRWWLLLPIAVIAAIVVGWLSVGALADDGPGYPFSVMIGYFLAFGAGCGVVASGTVLIGRGKDWRWLKPIVAIPSIFALGFGSHVAYFLVDAVARDAVFAAPDKACFERTYPAKLGSVELALPVSPALGFFDKGSNRPYGMWHNPDIRTLCSKEPAAAVTVRSLSFDLTGLGYESTKDASALFCSRMHPTYPWAEIVCARLDARKIVMDRPLYITAVSAADPFGLSPLSVVPVKEDPLTITADGLKIYQGKHDLIVRRPDGYVASCNVSNHSKAESYLRCSARDTLFGGLVMSYEFNTTEARFIQTTPDITETARAFVRSVTRQEHH